MSTGIMFCGYLRQKVTVFVKYTHDFTLKRSIAQLHENFIPNVKPVKCDIEQVIPEIYFIHYYNRRLSSDHNVVSR